MSGVDEQESYWVLEYKVLNQQYDYEYQYRGFLARDVKEAKKYGETLIAYFMQQYGGDEDLEEFVCGRVFRIDSSNPFIYDAEELAAMMYCLEEGLEEE